MLIWYFPSCALMTVTVMKKKKKSLVLAFVRKPKHTVTVRALGLCILSEHIALLWISCLVGQGLSFPEGQQRR